MKRKPNPEKTDRVNPAWKKETFSRARPAREVLPKLVGGCRGETNAQAARPSKNR